MVRGGFLLPPLGEGRRDATAGGADAGDPAAGDTPLPPFDPKFATRKYGGYDVVTAAAGRDTHGKAGRACGGVALIVREDTDRFAVENAEVVGENVISCEMVTGSGKGEGDETRWFMVGFYCWELK